MGKEWKQWQAFWAPKSLQMMTTAMKLISSPWKKSYDQPDSVLKSRNITLPTKVCLVKAMIFPVVMYGCENRTIKKSEHWRTDAFELWYWRRLLRVPWTSRRWYQPILKEKERKDSTKLYPTVAIPWTVAYQAPLSMGFSRQENWSGLSFPSPKVA